VTLCCRFSALAEHDLDEIALFIAADNPRRAIIFIEELRAHCLKVAERPLAYPLREEYGTGIRLTIHGSYVIFHSQRDDALVIERIVHGARHREGLVRK
jgi:toxin ParE1/3/4